MPHRAAAIRGWPRGTPGSRGCRARPVAGEGFAQQPHLGAVYPFVVHLGKCVEFAAQAAVCIILLDAGLGQPDELRVQREGRVGVVGVGVLPGVGHRGVVDRQELDHALLRGDGPVYEQLQVEEFADSETLLRTEREDGDGRTGAAPVALRNAGLQGGLDQPFAVRGDAVPDAVGTLFPQNGGEGCTVGDQELVFAPLREGQAEFPFGKAGVVERDDPLPVVEAVGGDGQRFVGPQCRNGHPEGRLCGGFVFPAALCGRPCCPASEDAAGVGHRAERCVGADILPAVVDPQRPAVGELRGAERVGIPFGTDLRIVAFDRIAVFEPLRSGTQLDTGVPDAVVGVPHGDFPFPEQQDELFAPAGTVFDVEIEFHRLVGLCRLDLVLSTQK